MCRIGDLIGRTLNLEIRPHLATLNAQSVVLSFSYLRMTRKEGASKIAIEGLGSQSIGGGVT